MKKIYQHWTRYAGLVGLFLLLVLEPFNLACATGFSVSPVKVDLTEKKKVVSLQVYNNGDRSTSIQAELMQWQQIQGLDIQENISRDILVTPPIFTLAPGETQVIRVGLRRPVALDQELSYRLFLQEIPAPNIQDTQGVTMLMRVSLPVFVEPNQQKIASNLQWKIQRIKPNELLLIADNVGNVHSKITELNLQRDGIEALKKQGNFYILSGASVQWNFKIKEPIVLGDEIQLKIKTSSGFSTYTLQLSE